MNKETLLESNPKQNEVYVSDVDGTIYRLFGATDDVALVHRCVIKNDRLMFKRLMSIEHDQLVSFADKPA